MHDDHRYLTGSGTLVIRRRVPLGHPRIAQERIAAWAAAAGLTILPPATVEDTIDRTAAGLDPATGKACGPPLDRDYAMERWILPMGARGCINAHVECAAECTLQLEIKVSGHGTELYAAPFDTGQPWQAELERRLRQVIGISHADAVRCGMANRHVVLLLERAPGGAVRCEPAALATMVTEYAPKVNACMCAMALQKEHPTTARSYLIYPSPLPPTDRVTRNGKLISTFLIGGDEYRPDGTAPWFLRGDDSITDCFAARTDDVTKTRRTRRWSSTRTAPSPGRRSPIRRACSGPTSAPASRRS